MNGTCGESTSNLCLGPTQHTDVQVANGAGNYQVPGHEGESRAWRETMRAKSETRGTSRSSRTCTHSAPPTSMPSDCITALRRAMRIQLAVHDGGCVAKGCRRS